MKTALRRLLAKSIQVGSCLLWRGGSVPQGYGIIKLSTPVRRSAYVHRVAWELYHGAPVPDGLEIDHKCRNRACWNPLHLEAVTHKVNQSRGALAQRTHCNAGHEFSAANTRIGKRGQRECRACDAAEKRAARKAAHA